MIHKKPESQKWRITPYKGIQLCGLRQSKHGGGTVLLQIAPGARFPLHDHPGGEEVSVIYGRAVVGKVTVHLRVRLTRPRISRPVTAYCQSAAWRR